MARAPTASTSLAQATALVAPIYARLLRVLLQHAEVDGDRVLASAGLDWATLIKDDRRLSRATIILLAQAAMAATRRPWLGLDLGGTVPVSAHGPLGYAAVTAPTLRGAMHTMPRYGATRTDMLAWTCVETPAGLTMSAVECAELGAARCFALDTVMAALLRVIEAAVGQMPRSLEVDMPFPAPPWREQYQRFAQVPVHFDRPALAFHVGRADLELPCLGADARAHAAACRECDEEMARLSASSLSQRVAALLADVDGLAQARYPSLTDMAQRCGVSARTLIRRLGDDGTSYHQLLDAARKQRALWLLQHSPEPVEEIAARLGYLDTSNFSRTVRRWFGRSPRELRRGDTVPG